jgi:endogenous inhibitor of DNA gyrase (YacG/DUF329 family)
VTTLYCPHCGQPLDTIDQPNYRREGTKLIQNGFLQLHSCWNPECPFEGNTVSTDDLAEWAEPAYDIVTGKHRPAWTRVSFFSLEPDQGD